MKPRKYVWKQRRVLVRAGGNMRPAIYKTEWYLEEQR